MVDDKDGGKKPRGDKDADGLPGGRIPGPPPPRDEWVAKVVDDPASGLRPVLLQGYVGDAGDEERTRIYLDPSLATFVDVRNEDILHHEELEGDHVPAGGRMVWVRGDALVSQAPAAGADFFAGPVLEQNRQPGGDAQKAPEMQITLLTVAGCATRWFWCPPENTAATLCTHQVICSHVCQQGGGGLKGAAPVGGDMTRMPCSAVDACPSALGCTSFQGCEPGPVLGPTAWQGCGQPSHLLGCTGWLGCGQPHISLPGCIHTGTCPSAVDACPTAMCGGGMHAMFSLKCPVPVPDTREMEAGGLMQHAAFGTVKGGAGIPTGQYGPQCPTFGFTCTYVHCPPAPTEGLGCPSTSTCPPTEAFGCPRTSTCPPTEALGCPRTSTCPPTEAFGCPRTRTCPPTEAFGCPRTSTCPPTGGFGCPRTSTCPPTGGFGCPRTSTCPPTEAFGCPPTSTCPPTGGFGCPRTSTCPPTGGFGCPNTSTCPPTEAFGCPRTSTCPPTGGFGCPNTSTCAPQGGGTVEAAAYTYHQGCPTFGFTCTQFC